MGCMPLLLRTKSGSSKVSLNRPNVLDMAGWVIESRSAALETLPSSSNTSNETNRLRSILASLFKFILYRL